VASIIFLDSPVGSGFSYARNPRGYDVGYVSSSRQVVEFLGKVWKEHAERRGVHSLIHKLKKKIKLASSVCAVV